MKSLIGAAFVAGALVVAGPAAINPAAAAPQAKAQSCRHIRCHRFQRAPPCQALLSSLRLFIVRTTVPITTDRPVYYRPYPYDAPAPFTFGIGFGPVLVVSVHNFGQPQISFVLSPARSSLRPAHS